MVKHLLTLSRKQELSLVPLDLNYPMNHVMKICESSFDKSIELKFEFKESPVMINADPTQIEQVLLNVCVNAGHSMTIMREKNEKWGGKLTVLLGSFLPDKYFLESHPEAEAKEYQTLIIKDTGIGISKDTISKIFTPFFTTKEYEKGTGLGLSMVYNIVKQHNGFLTVYSELGIGTKFIIYLPVPDDLLKEVKDEDKTVIPQGEGLILIVDDEQIIRKTAENMFEEFGYNAITAENGKVALDIFEKQYKDIEAVLLDVNMPVMSGKETYLKMKEIDPHVKVLLQSGHAEEGRIEEILGLGANHFIHKPYGIKELAEAVNSLCRETS